MNQRQLSDDRRCSVCRVPLPQHRLAAGVCDDRECVSVAAGRRIAREHRLEEERLQRLAVAAEQLKVLEAERAGIEEPGAYSVAVVPSFDGVVRPRDEERVKRMMARIESIVHWAFGHPPRDEDSSGRTTWSSVPGESQFVPYTPDEISAEASEVESPLFAAGCRLCQGHCCRTGGEHAYIDVALIRRFMADHPAASEQQVVDAYLARVPAESIEDSCVYHGAFGCVLPREMRSNMCNRWLCTGLNLVRTSLEEGAAPRFFVAATHEDQIVRAEFVSVDDELQQRLASEQTCSVDSQDAGAERIGPVTQRAITAQAPACE